MVPMDKEKLIKFWKTSPFVSGSRNFWRIRQHCKTVHFSIVWLIYLRKNCSDFMKILSWMHLGQESPR